MKAFILKALAVVSFSAISTIHLNAQSSVSIGTDALKDKAVLWLKANGSQGLILPSLTTAERNALSPNNSDEKGMVVYDNQLNKIFYWNGSDWNETGGGASVTLSGDVSGTPSTTIVSGLKGKSLPGTLPASTQFLAYDGSSWTFQSPSTSGSVTSVTGTSPISVSNTTTTPAISITQASATTNGYLSSTDWTTFNNKLASGTTASGDLTGTLTNPTVARIRGINVSTSTPTTNQVLQFNGTNWTPATLATGLTNPMTSTGDIIYGGTSGTATRLATGAGFLKGGTTPSWSAISLATDITGTLPRANGGTGLTTTPSNGQLLIGNGTGYTLATLTAGTGVSITNTAGSITVNSTGLTNPMTTTGDIIYGGTSGTATRLATGTGFLKAGTTPAWSSIDLTTDVSGTLPLTAGGTGATTAANARTNLGLGALAVLNTVSSTQINDATIVDADISATAAIAGSKVSPAFGAQNITTTGTLSTGNITTSNLASVNSVTYTWPASQGGASTVLTNDGSGTLSWAAAGSGTALSTTNVIPKGNGTTQVASSLTDNGTTVSSSNDFNLATGKVIKVNNSTVFSTIGANNLFAGSGAAAANTGINNTFLGFIAGAANTSAGDNVFVGSNAGKNITIGNSNTFVGSGAGQNPTNAYLSVFVGFKAGRLSDQGGNVFVGASAGENATGGLNNFIGENAGVNTTSGSQNTFVGRNTGATNTTGSAIVLLGNESNVGSANLSNATAIGPSAIVNASNAMVLGSVGTSVAVGTTTPDATVSLDVVSAKSGFVARFDRNITSGTGILGFYRQGLLQGNISESAGTISYNTFTGSHFASSPVPLTLGTLVTLTGKTEYMPGNADPIYEVIPSHQPNDPKLLGSFLHDADDDIKVNNKTIRTIMAVGNGIMWVADNGENIEPGDYLISSAVPGHAMKDHGQYEIAYIIARAGEPIRWGNETANIDGIKHKKISVFYESFVRNYKAEKLEKELLSLQQQVNSMKSESADQLNQMKIELENLKKMLMAFSNN